MPSSSSWTAKTRTNAISKNLKVEYPGGMIPAFFQGTPCTLNFVRSIYTIPCCKIKL